MSEELESTRLNVLGVEIKTLHQQAVQTTLEYCIEIGKRLTEAKGLVGHGNWSGWLEQNVGYSQSQAGNYMKLYRGYGSGQIGLFGDSLPKNIECLDMTKALALLDIPEDERESFAEEVKAEDISVRQLKEKVQEYKETAENAIRQADNMKKNCDDAQDIARDAMDRLDEANTRVAVLQKKLQELENKPPEVVVAEPSEDQLKQLRDEAAKEEQKKFQKEREKLQTQLKDAQKQKQKAEEKAASAAEEAAAAALKSVKDEQSEELKVAQARAEEAERKLKTADPAATELKIYVTQMTEAFNRALGVAIKCGGDTETKYRKFLQANLDQMKGRLS